MKSIVVLLTMLVVSVGAAHADYGVTLVAPATSLAPSGAAVQLSGGGRFDPVSQSVTISGRYVELGSDGARVREGTWKAISFLRFMPFDGKDKRELGGVLEVMATLSGAPLPVRMRIVSGMNRPVKFGEEEGVTVGEFVEKSSGAVRFSR
jgi:hypothetical protein